MDKQPCVYILTNRPEGVLYIGVTSNLVKRVWEHKHNAVDGFTRRYNVHRLVYYELFADMTHAIIREKQLKKWRRAWKVALIQQVNPEWDDLFVRLQ